jgi:hypothetical protein
MNGQATEVIMTEAYTKLADVIVPEVFNPYMRELSTSLNAFWQSGIVGNVADLAFGKGGGQTIQMPFYKSLSDDAQLLDDNTDLEVKAIDTGKDVAVQHARALVWGATDLSAAFSGADPMMAIASYAANNWSIEFTKVLLNTLAGALGALAAESPAVNSYNISALSGAAAVIDGHSFIDAAQMLGDHKVNLVAIGMHSATEASLAKNDLIETIRDSDGKLVMNTFMGKRVIVDDALAPASGGVYTSWLFGEGSIGFGEGAPKVPTETDRFALKAGGQEFLVTRRHFVLHPRGVKWTPGSGVPVKESPSNSELADVANWSRVYENKNIRLVQFVHKV